MKMRKSRPRLELNSMFAREPVPFASYPRPQMMRTSYQCLNGPWQLSVRTPHGIQPLGEVTVPFPPESAASGIGRTLAPDESWIYERDLIVPPSSEGDRVILHIGAADQTATVYVNDCPVVSHEGGYHAFSADITDALRAQDNRLRVEVWDPMDATLPYGKQCRRPHGMWYSPVSGLWQTVWCERVPSSYIRSLRITPSLTGFTLQVDGGELHKRLSLMTPDGEQVTEFDGDRVTVTVTNPCLWSPEDPHLYLFTLESGQDTVASYAALRTVETAVVDGVPRLLLNGRPYFFHGLLDQGYYSDGIFLPSSREGYRSDIARMKALGFNTLRKHIKIEPDIFYYECDVQGMLVFQDMVNNGRYSFLLDTALPTVGIRRGIAHPPPKAARERFEQAALQTVEQLYNHPSVVYYTIFNEGWGQFDADRLYRQLKAVDPTRIWDATSGWFFGRESDVQSEHVYFRPVKLKAGQRPLVLSEFGGYSCVIPGHAACPDHPYGYRMLPDPAALTQALGELYEQEIIPAIHKGLCAAILTQLSDVEEETNGLLTYDRWVCKVEEPVMRRIAQELSDAFEKGKGAAT